MFANGDMQLSNWGWLMKDRAGEASFSSSFPTVPDAFLPHQAGCLTSVSYAGYPLTPTRVLIHPRPRSLLLERFDVHSADVRLRSKRLLGILLTRKPQLYVH